MEKEATIAVVGTFDSKGEEHLFLKHRIEARGFRTLTINVGTKSPSPFTPDYDLYAEVLGGGRPASRDSAITAVLEKARSIVRKLHGQGIINGMISAGGGTGTHLGTGIMRALPMGVPKIMVSTVASRDMSHTVGTKDITMVHSVVDLLGVNSLSGGVLDRAAGAICGMVTSHWGPDHEKKRVALTMFGFITEAAENIKRVLEEKGYEVVAFHANGTGGMAMEELASEGYFDGILDLATHELADELKGGYCAGVGPQRLLPPGNRTIPRLVVPGGLDCAVLEFTRDDIPEEYRARPIFFYDFRSAVRLSPQESRVLAEQVALKLNTDPACVQVLVPSRGWSEADRDGGPLHAPEIGRAFVQRLRDTLDPRIPVREVEVHINDIAFAKLASDTLEEMMKGKPVD
jgi:uncharacterized protein (UPF0261 family)